MDYFNFQWASGFSFSNRGVKAKERKCTRLIKGKYYFLSRVNSDVLGNAEEIKKEKKQELN